MMFKSRSHCETSRATSQPFSREGANGRSPSQEDGSGAPEITGVLNPVNPLMFSMQSWKYNLCTFFFTIVTKLQNFHGNKPEPNIWFSSATESMLPMMHPVIGAGETKGDGGAKIC